MLRVIYNTFALALTILVVLVVASNIYVRVSTKAYIHTDVSAVSKAQAVMILGAGIKSNKEMSPVLKDRVVRALELYKAGTAEKILISGNNKEVVYPSDDEVNPVRVYLLKEGVPAQDIFTDHEGYDTYTSMYRAKHQFGVSSLIISTQQFHLPRAVFIARSFGIDAVGISADAGKYQDRNYLREYIAQPNAVYEVLSGRDVSIPATTNVLRIEGDGRESWEE